MNIMVDKETVVSAINKFIKSREMKDIITLFDYLCEVKQIPNKDEVVKAVTTNPVLMQFIVDRTLQDLEVHFGICRITDANNQLISVF